ncbi:MAG: hypothetical protein WCF67_25670 [Chitinophagaceae bacterium]
MWVLFLSVMIGVIYVIVGIVKKRITSDSLSNVFLVIFAMVSVICGTRLVIITFIQKQFFSDLSNIDLIAYTIFGGLAVTWLAVWELCRKFNELYKPKG